MLCKCAILLLVTDSGQAKLTKDHFEIFNDASQPDSKSSKVLQDAVAAALKSWMDGFNAKNGQQCANVYLQNAEMIARPFGPMRVGKDAIKEFWDGLISTGFETVSYQDIVVTPVTKDLAVLQANWTMNKAKGIIHQEVWQLQADGNARLLLDHFEALP